MTDQHLIRKAVTQGWDPEQEVIEKLIRDGLTGGSPCVQLQAVQNLWRQREACVDRKIIAKLNREYQKSAKFS